MKKFTWSFSNGWVRLLAGLLASLLVLSVVTLTTGKLSKGHTREGLYYEVTGLRPDGVLMEVNGEPITVEEYLYWVANDCGYLMNYGGIDDLNTFVTEDMTYADYIRTDVLTTEKLYGAVRAWAKSAGITVTEAQRTELEQQRQAYVEYYGSEEAYLEQLALLGVSEECFNRINETPYLYETLVNTCSDPHSSLYPGEAALRSFADEHGILTVKIAYLATDPAWSEEELEEQKAALTSYAEKLQAAGDKDAIFAEAEAALGLTVDTVSLEVSEGDTISDIASALEVGQSSDIASNGVDFFIIERLETDPTQVVEDYVAHLIEEKRDSAVVVYNSDLYDAINIADFYPALVEAQRVKASVE